MKLVVNDLKIPVEENFPHSCLLKVAYRTGLLEKDIRIYKILFKFLNLKDKNNFFYEVSLVIDAPDDYENAAGFDEYIEQQKTGCKPGRSVQPPVIIGFGPAGMFSALELIDCGIQPVIYERGKRIRERIRDIKTFMDTGHLNEESNIQFGEGGAGTYSDGKLFSRKKNTPVVQKVLDTFVRFGAPAEISYISKPHIGTDLLCKIVQNIREYILEKGGKLHFDSKITGLGISDGKINHIIINDNIEVSCSNIFLATGHSARKTFRMLHELGVKLQSKPLSVGLRIEHPRELIDFIRYGRKYQHHLGAATYSFNYTNRKIQRGVYTFCQCPGGEIINAASENGMLTLNGMSYSKRNSDFSNAAIVVTCKVQDRDHPLSGLEFQKQIEKKAFEAGGSNWSAPGQNLLDFLSSSPGEKLKSNSYQMGTRPFNLAEIYPEFITRELKNAFEHWKTIEPLFVSSHGVLLAAETRTTSPVRVVRDKNFESVNIKGLYPVGEGAGYAGGISSAAADGIKAARSFCNT